MRLSLFALALLVTTSLAQLPVFRGPYWIEDNGVPIDVGWYGAPLMYDWDGDGAKDLITGQFTGGYIRYYRNLGPDSSPVFNGFSYFTASGGQITLPYG